MTDDEWSAGFVRCFGMVLGGEAMEEFDDRGEQVLDDTFLLLYNADSAIDFTLPDVGSATGWEVVLDTNEPGLRPETRRYLDGDTLTLEGRSMAVLRAHTQPEENTA
jgi:glycogen operon protein